MGATPYSYYNLVTWTDNDGEEGEKYNVYASTEPITDSLSISTADVVATNVLEGTQAAVHYLHNPLEDSDVTYYYAVVCKDGSNNVGEPGSSDDPITNTAKGVPTISLTPPTAFVADGDLSEWYDSGIVPFELGATENSYGTPHLGFGAVDDDNDLYGTIFTAVDDDYFYLAAEIVDNVVNNDDSGGWWTADVVQLCFGFYDQLGPKHVGMQRGAEPDYKMYFTPAGANSDNGAGVLATHGDGNYFHEVFNPDYAFEFRISLDSILIDDDVRLIPADGIRTPLVGVGDEIIPLTYALNQNYPNPFNPITNIQFTIPEQADVKLRIYNVLGRQVDVLVNETLPIGHHQILWNPRNLSSGVYFYKLEAGSFIKTRKMILLK